MTRNAFTIERVFPLDDEVYSLAVEEVVRRSCSRVWIAMFFVDPYPYDDKTGEVRRLLRTLTRAHHNHVDVRVLVDAARGTAPINIGNQLTYLLLRSAGVPCRYYAGTRRSMHSKYLIIDADTVIVGSHNFSSGAFARHRESSLLMHSRDLAGSLSIRFQSMWASSQNLVSARDQVRHEHNQDEP